MGLWYCHNEACSSFMQPYFAPGFQRRSTPEGDKSPEPASMQCPDCEQNLSPAGYRQAGSQGAFPSAFDALHMTRGAVEVPKPDPRPDDWHYVIDSLIGGLEYEGVVKWLAQHGSLDEALAAAKNVRAG